ncbi:phage baseplate assembly protein V [Amantichitinum ursilacus]|uniref:Phage-related baseplate assembly protein n=1 Tax=Amantichitinum ursilacus TaxID=857265 RepID=A0A0N0GMK6_9NEIS|nr:phage baseplate assembly protein V [Amantichitinum ursilacus]KPC51525.1 Phage-related baseplate assembly protein [Amantichitinum ursilacus]
MSEGKYYGKYRGVVLNNIDPMQTGRIQVQVPDVLGVGISSWAMPCVPFAGIQSGIYTVPQVGSGVWVEFEQGDHDYPIWVGGFWGSAAEVPALALAGLPVSPSIVLQTGSQNTVMLSDLPGPTGGILLKSTTGALISITEIGITISNGQGATIMLTGPMVSINQGALTVV